jgi:hypothetical protein
MGLLGDFGVLMGGPAYALKKISMPGRILLEIAAHSPAVMPVISRKEKFLM